MSQDIKKASGHELYSLRLPGLIINRAVSLLIAVFYTTICIFPYIYYLSRTNICFPINPLNLKENFKRAKHVVVFVEQNTHRT